LNTKVRGDWGEALTADYLRKRGYVIVAAKYRCRFGEIDLIARKGERLCFVEVKARSETEHGLPREFVTAAKQQKLRVTAQHYLSTHRLDDAPCRFDVCEIYGEPEREPDQIRIEYIENAF